MQRWSLRPVCANDLRVIARHRYHQGEPESDVEAYARWLGPRLGAGRYVGFVAEAQGEIVAGAGAVLLDWGPTRSDPTGTRARIANVFTVPAWRRQGIARALVVRVMQACRERGAGGFNLAATRDSQALYRSLGFVPYESEMILRPGTQP